MTEAIIYRTRRVDPIVRREVERLAHDLPHCQIFIVCYQRDYKSAMHSTPGEVYCFGQRDLHDLPYPRKVDDVNWNDPTGHHDLPVLKFFLQQDEFDWYWVIEDDVRCSGPWTGTFRELARSDADLLMTVVQDYDEVTDWHWWSSLVTGDEIVPTADRVKGFGPFCRLSRTCLRAIDRKYREGWGGHFEVTWPNIARASGLTIEDVGAHGKYTPAARQGKFYTCTVGSWHLFPGTFVFRPPFHDTGASEFGKHLTPHSMLWHPVKV